MFERFSAGSRQAIVAAQEEARGLRHNYIGTEHLLLALMRERGGVPALVLRELGLETEKVRREVVQIVGTGEEMTKGQIPFTPRLKLVLEKSLQEGLSRGLDEIGTDSLWLALVEQREGVAARILADLGAYPDDVRQRVLRATGPAGAARLAAMASQRLLAVEGLLAAFGRRHDMARIVGEAENAEAAARALCRELDLFPDQAEAVLDASVSRWTRAEQGRLEQERDALRAQLGNPNGPGRGGDGGRSPDE